MFNILREHITLISAISYQEPGFPRFCWDMTMTVLSIDGYAIPLARIRQAIHSAIDGVDNGLDTLFGSCPYRDILKYIDSRLDPNPESGSMTGPRTIRMALLFTRMNRTAWGNISIGCSCIWSRMSGILVPRRPVHLPEEVQSKHGEPLAAF